MKRKSLCCYMVIAGLLLLGAGLWLLRAGENDSRIAPYLCIGFGCGILGQGLDQILVRYSSQRSPETARRLEIEENDERNVALRNRAQAQAYRIMLPVFGTLFVAFGLMDVEMKVILLLMAAYVFICACSIYYRIKYEKEM